MTGSPVPSFNTGAAPTALAIQAAQRGMSVAMADLQSDDFDSAIEAVEDASRHGSQSVVGVAADVSDPEQVDKLKVATLDAFGKVDFPANAVTRIGRGIDAEIDEWRHLFDVNL